MEHCFLGFLFWWYSSSIPFFRGICIAVLRFLPPLRISVLIFYLDVKKEFVWANVAWSPQVMSVVICLGNYWFGNVRCNWMIIIHLVACPSSGRLNIQDIYLWQCLSFSWMVQNFNIQGLKVKDAVGRKRQQDDSICFIITKGLNRYMNVEQQLEFFINSGLVL